MDTQASPAASAAPASDTAAKHQPCCVCWEDTPPEQWQHLRCAHGMCRTCYTKCCSRLDLARCPMCRTEFEEGSPRRVAMARAQQRRRHRFQRHVVNVLLAGNADAMSADAMSAYAEPVWVQWRPRGRALSRPRVLSLSSSQLQRLNRTAAGSSLCQAAQRGAVADVARLLAEERPSGMEVLRAWMAAAKRGDAEVMEALLDALQEPQQLRRMRCVLGNRYNILRTALTEGHVAAVAVALRIPAPSVTLRGATAAAAARWKSLIQVYRTALTTSPEMRQVLEQYCASQAATAPAVVGAPQAAAAASPPQDPARGPMETAAAAASGGN